MNIDIEPSVIIVFIALCDMVVTHYIDDKYTMFIYILSVFIAVICIAMSLSSSYDATKDLEIE